MPTTGQKQPSHIVSTNPGKINYASPGIGSSVHVLRVAPRLLEPFVFV